MICCWKYDYCIYKTDNPTILDIHRTAIVAYLARIVIGTGISVAILFLFKFYEKSIPFKGFLNSLSRNSLGIYVMHLTLLQNLDYSGKDCQISEFQYTIYSFAIALLFVLLLNYMISIIRMTKFSKFVLLGE
jgi:surface polysaccharide O-acyltransferase-like enzyme